ncbi:helix-turn-helix domain-containing protein [Streptomyces solicathayae]|uniref:Helix-turn-helix domain-containing protein n=1 Tax=Streptomyces solicathayae TaxID=3081768 RepID=A0ABZ0M3F4_9ACTN|nr:helix-turn-helix domain-containing protein [Streptomyces sp. HUAS YS2]WOX26176.1 helix-turn-helix domain-containing protein [Streptomyces sp. HUAS YS2]
MNDGTWEREAALTELRRRLDDGLATLGLTKTQLAARAGLGRTTVQEAFNPKAPVASPGTVASLSNALGLPETELLRLRRFAVGEDAAVSEAEPIGRPIAEWDPHHLEVHPAGTGEGHLPGSALSGYVLRNHDRVLAEAVSAAASGDRLMVVLVGSSSTGKTRACWEAVQPLGAKGWHLWHPFNPTRAEAAHDELAHVGPHTVVWLNEAQHYLGDHSYGERIAAALHALLTAPERGPVLVLGTLWPEYARQYTAQPTPGLPDPHSRVRELLTGRVVHVPDAFDAKALQEATARARTGDQLLADALGRARRSGRVAQDLAGAPLLLHRYLTASPPARAVLEAAMDARRLGVGLHLLQDFLTEAAVDYIDEEDYVTLHHTRDWAQDALDELAETVHGKQAPLRPANTRPKQRPPGDIPSDESGVTGPVFRLADYLEQHGRRTRSRLCPPASFWSAALSHLTQFDDLSSLAAAAKSRHRLQWAHHLQRRAELERAGVTGGLRGEIDERHDLEKETALLWSRAVGGDPDGAEAAARITAASGSPMGLHVMGIWRAEAGDRAAAEALLRQAVEAGWSAALRDLAMLRDDAGDPQDAEALAIRAAKAGHTEALRSLVKRREESGNSAAAEALAQALADTGSPTTLRALAVRRQEAGDTTAAEALLRYCAETGDVPSLHPLCLLREDAGDHEAAEVMARQAAAAGNSGALHALAIRRLKDGATESAHSLFREAADIGDTKATRALIFLSERAGQHEDAEAVARQASATCRRQALRDLAVLRAKGGDMTSAETLFREAAAAGHPYALGELIRWHDENGDSAEAEALAREAVHTDINKRHPLHELARWRDRNGDAASARALYREAACLGHHDALMELAVSWERARDLRAAEAVYREAADAGNVDALRALIARHTDRGEQAEIEALHREAADSGNARFFSLDSRWPSGLDPDGRPTPPWNKKTRRRDLKFGGGG